MSDNEEFVMDDSLSESSEEESSDCPVSDDENQELTPTGDPPQPDQG